MESLEHRPGHSEISADLSAPRRESLNSVGSNTAEELLSDNESLVTLHGDHTTIPAEDAPRTSSRLGASRWSAYHLSASHETQPLSEETLEPHDPPSTEGANKRSHSSALRKLHWWWFWELGGITISVCCMVAILILLPYLDNRPLNDWKFLMAPNTMISTFITVAKTSMLLAVAEGISQLKWHYFKTRKRPLRELDIFDAASRGPWGAFVFMIRMSGKPGALFAMLGAFVVVSSLTMEPFAQQIMSFETRRVNSTHDVASFNIRRAWDSTIGDDKGQQSMESAFMKGLVSSPAGFQFSCSSGNCTWPAFSALGFCAQCADVTGDTQQSDNVTTAFNASSKGDTGLDGHPDDCVDFSYTTPLGLSLKMSRGCSFEHRISWDPACDLDPSSTANHAIPLSSLKARGPTSTIKRHEAAPSISTAPHTPILDPRVTGPPTSASLHTLYKRPPVPLTILKCVDTIQALPTSMASNITYSNFNGKVSNSTIMVLAVSQANVTETGLAGRISGPSHTHECQMNWCEKVFKDVKVTNGIMEQVNTTSRPLSESQINNDIGYWKSWVEGGRRNSSNVPDAWRYIADQMTFAVAADGNAKFGPGSVISNAANIQDVVDNIAEAMTRQLYVGDGSVPQPGIAYVQEVFVVVHWQWAVFPMLLVLLGLIFLAANLWINSRDGVFLWKSSLLPLLFHGLDGCDPEVLDVDDNSEMTKIAKRLYAKLERNEVGSTKLVST